MKRSLIICFALIFLLSLSFISAFYRQDNQDGKIYFDEWLNNLWGKITGKTTFQRTPIEKIPVCIDLDLDSYGENCLAGLDCNDNNANINPGAAEVCINNVDDDCDGQIDEGCLIEQITRQTVPVAQCITEVCGNNLDDDCDGQVDEGCSIQTPFQRQTQPIAQCITEICGNNFDDDCDGQIDEGCLIKEITRQTVPVAQCITEVCENNFDDDCDGQIDEGCLIQISPGEISTEPLKFKCADNDGFGIYTKNSITSEQGNVWEDQCGEYINGVPLSNDCFGNDCYLFEMLCNPVDDPSITELSQSFDGIYQAKLNCPNGCYDGACEEESCGTDSSFYAEEEAKRSFQQSPTNTFEEINKKTKISSSLSELNNEYYETNSFKFAKKKEIKKELEELVKERKEKLIEMMEKDPGLFLQQRIFEENRQEFSKKVQQDIEQEIIVEGELGIMIIEDLVEENFEERYFLKLSDNTRLRLYFYPQFAGQAQPGSQIEVKGWKLENQMVIESFKLENFKILSEPQQFTKQQSPQSKKTEGLEVKKVAVIFYNFQDNPITSHTYAEVRNVIFTGPDSVKNYYEEVSYGKLTLEGVLDPANGDIFGWYTVPYNSICGDEIFLGSDVAKQMATSDGFVESDYTNIIFVFSGNLCPWGGAAYLGVPGSTETIESWIDELLYPHIVAHELGHNFGTGHANSINCTSLDKGGGVPVTMSPFCTKFEYGDPFDEMGGGYYHMSGYHKIKVGFLESPNIQDVVQSGTYTVTALELTTNNVQVLKIPLERDPSGNVVSYYYIEYRGRIPGSFDDFDVTNPVIHGVSIKSWEPSQYRSYLLDMTPDTSSFVDSALGVGETFNDPVTGISITTTGVNPYVSAQVYIDVSNFQTCMRRTPLISISPCGQSGPAGEEVEYFIDVTNRDSPSCPSSPFSISSLGYSPTGWAGWVGWTSPNFLLSPGERGVLSFYIRSPLDAIQKSYRLDVQIGRLFNYPPYLFEESATTWIKILPPLPYEIICNDGIDNDENGQIDCSEWVCKEESYCAEDCTNGIDDNNNGILDCQDNIYCWNNPACIESICNDGIDNDGFGDIDCGDWDCREESYCAEDCTNGIDDNNNGNIDCQDGIYCWNNPAC